MSSPDEDQQNAVKSGEESTQSEEQIKIEKKDMDVFTRFTANFLIPFWFIFIFGIIINWCILRFLVFKDYYDKMSNPNKLFDLSIYEPGNLEYYLYLLGIPFIISIILSLIYYIIF